MTTLHFSKSIGRSLSWRCGFVLVPLALVCFGLSPTAKAQLPPPPPDGGYPGANTAEGDNALLSLTSGLANTAVGNGALRDNTTGGFNVAVGSRALASNITGSFNMAVGTEALTKNNANYNTAIGADALTLNIDGASNTAVGFQALQNNDSDNNAALGSQALQDNVGGIDNTAVGFQAMQFNVSAFTNAALGTFAAQNNDSSGNGIAFFNTAVGGFALQANVDGTRNTAVGAGAMESGNGGNDNTAVGEVAGTNITGNSNTCLGHSAGNNLAGGEGNIYIGAQVQAGDPGEVEFIRIGDDTAFTFPYDTFIAGIQNRAVSAAANPHFVLVDDNGKLGTVSVNEIGIKTKQLQGVPQRVQPQAIGPDPKQAMLNRTVKELQATVARQQKQIDALSAGLQKVSAQLEVRKPAPQVVGNK